MDENEQNSGELISTTKLRIVYPENADPQKFDPPLNMEQKKLLYDINYISRTIKDKERFLNYVNFVSDIKNMRGCLKICDS